MTPETTIEHAKKHTKEWFVYLMRCNDASLYCGVTTDIKRREQEHNHGPKGAKYTRVRRPVTLVYLQSAVNRSEACQLEAKIKKLSKRNKEVLVAQHQALLKQEGLL
ncbi:endonuclease [Alteromonadales bacterium alter-6D02]|nr:endonuclease [Alteromonadales bacterium alter-6D02]